MGHAPTVLTMGQMLVSKSQFCLALSPSSYLPTSPDAALPHHSFSPPNLRLRFAASLSHSHARSDVKLEWYHHRTRPFGSPEPNLLSQNYLRAAVPGPTTRDLVPDTDQPALRQPADREGESLLSLLSNALQKDLNPSDAFSLPFFPRSRRASCQFFLNGNDTIHSKRSLLRFGSEFHQ